MWSKGEFTAATIIAERHATRPAPSNQDRPHMSELDKAYAQIESLAWRLARIMAVCERLQMALTHPSSPELHKAALASYRKLFENYPEPQPPPGKPCP